MTKLSVKDICNLYGVAEHTVLKWIRNGELKAFDVSRSRGRRPTWRVSEEALKAFEASRTPMAPEPVVRRRRKQNPEINYY